MGLQQVQTNPTQSGPGINGNEKVFPTHQSSAQLTGAVESSNFISAEG